MSGSAAGHDHALRSKGGVFQTRKCVCLCHFQRYDSQRRSSEAGMPLQEDGSIDDWELFPDPREQERRKAERRRAALPPEVSVSCV